MSSGKIFSKTGNMSSAYLFLLSYCLIFLSFNSSLLADSDKSARMTPVVKAVRDILPSVVNLSVSESQLEKDGAADDSKSRSVGSGCIIDPSGLLVTNSHVISQAYMVDVTLFDGKKYSAVELANDYSNDLALLKIENLPDNVKLKPVKTAIPGDLLLGETVIVVGNPYGLGSSVSKGIISAIGRKVVYRGKIVFSDIIQTDAPIYPGNSGGPLINIEGRMIGISTAVHKDARGIGFAIPLMRIENVLAKWLTPERFNNAYFGLIPAVRKSNGNGEIYVSSVRKGSPAWNAGVRGGEDIVAFNGEKIDSLLSLIRKFRQLKTGDKVELSDASGKIFSINLLRYELEDGALAAKEKLGISVEKLSPRLAKALKYPFLDGVIINGVEDANGVFKRGDVLSRLDDIPIRNLEDISRALKNKRPGDRITVVVEGLEKTNGTALINKKSLSATVK
jgi:serine protease Do